MRSHFLRSALTDSRLDRSSGSNPPSGRGPSSRRESLRDFTFVGVRESPSESCSAQHTVFAFRILRRETLISKDLADRLRILHQTLERRPSCNTTIWRIT